NIEVKADNVKLKQALEKYEVRFINLEQRDTETINNILQEYKGITNSTENLTLVNELVQGLLQDFTSHNNQCWESIEITSPTSIPENLQKLAHYFIRQVSLEKIQLIQNEKKFYFGVTILKDMKIRL
ncbi:16761_t:CDS:1, partial [Acaulospora morrowiae]